jgi:alpha-tubulin suppressor-like RCC1 family protein
MSTFLTIPQEEIEAFLAYYGIESEDPYLEAWNLILDNPDLEIPSLAIKDFILAYDHQESLQTAYTKSSILKAEDSDLTRLSQKLGLEEVNRERIIRILGYLDLIKEEMAVQIIAHRATTFLLDSDGQVYGWGYNRNGQLGLGDALNRSKANSINFSSSIISVATSGYHSLFLKETGEVYSCGLATEGQLGLGTSVKKNILLTQSTPQKIILPVKIQGIAAGAHHSLFLSEKGQVWACGDNSFGQLGTMGVSEADDPLPIKAWSGRAIKLAAGDDFSLILDDQGQVYSFGSNQENQLGLGPKFASKEGIIFPTLIEGLEEIVDLAVGHHHTLLLGESGLVYSFGHNTEGQLGLGDKKNRNYPELVDLPTQIVALAAGEHHSLFLDVQGQVYVCGSNTYGQLKMGSTKESLVPLLISFSFPIVTIAAGSDDSFFLDNQGQLASSGSNNFGQLGLGDNKYRLSSSISVIL